jgi:competence transcription factor ComK
MCHENFLEHIQNAKTFNHFKIQFKNQKTIQIQRSHNLCTHGAFQMLCIYTV